VKRLLAPVVGLALALAVSCGGKSMPEASLTLTADLSQLPAGTDAASAVQETVEILLDRANRYGVKGPQITADGDTISVALKGITGDSAGELMTRTGILDFKREKIAANGLVVCKTLQGEEFGVPPRNVNPDPTSGSLARCFASDKLGEPEWVDAEVVDGTGAATRLGVSHVEHGSWSLTDGDTSLSVRFTPRGSDILKRVTGPLAGYHLGIFLDGRLIAAPRIQRAITDGSPIISGFQPETARILAAVLNTNPLPVPLAPARQ